MGENILKPVTTKHALYCSFCGKSQYEVDALVAGPLVYICNECVDLCADIITEHRRQLAENKS